MKKVAKRKKTERKKFGWQEWALVGIVGVAAVTIVLALCTLTKDSPTERADKELANLAKSYYVEYLYPRLLGGKMDSDPTPAMKVYDETGVPTTYLRQLLYYNDNDGGESAEIFAKIECNTNLTGVKYFPVAPYGPTDYTVTYIWQCEGRQ